MNEFTLTERRTLNKLIEVARKLSDRADKITDALGPDIDGLGMFGEERAAIVDAIIVALNLDPSEWNEDIIYDIIDKREPIDTFNQFAVRVGGDYTNLAYTTGCGYFKLDENPDLAEKLNRLFGGDGQ